MKKIIIIFALLLVGFIIYRFNIRKEPGFRVQNIEKTSDIYNITHKNSYIDTILYIGLNHLKIRDVVIVVKPLTDDIKLRFSQDIELKAYVRNSGKQYQLYIDGDLNRSESIEILSHELIHIKQYNDGRLIVGEQDIYWGNEIIKIEDLYKIPYFNRLWEIEAFSEQEELTEKIKQTIY